MFGGVITPGDVSGAAAGGGAATRNTISTVTDGIGRLTRVNFDNGQYRTLTYTTTSSDIVATFSEYDVGDVLVQTYQVNYDVDGYITTPHTLV